MICSRCGNEVKDGERFCNNCGQSMETAAPAQTQPQTQAQNGYYNTQQNAYNNTQPQNGYYNNQQGGYNTQPQNGYYNNQQGGYNGQPNGYYPNNGYQQPQKPESSVLGVLAIIFSILGGCLGLILCIVGLSTYKLPENRRNCKIALGLNIAWFIIGIIAGIASAM